MGFCGDAVKVSNDELEQLWQLQKLIYDQRRLVAEAKKLSSGEALTEIEKQISGQNEILRSLQSTYEKLQDDKRKLESDIELVQKKISDDESRMKNSANPKDIAGFQHEIDGLKSRKEMLEDSELGLLEELESISKQLSKQRESKAELEESLHKRKEGLSEELGRMKLENQNLNTEIAAIRSSLAEELIAKFDARLAKGNAIGRIVRSACTACNMNLNSTAIAEISKVPMDEMASCPECNAIVIR